MVDVDNFSTFRIDAEDVDGFAELFRLQYDGLKDLDEKFERNFTKVGRVASTFGLPSTSIIAK